MGRREQPRRRNLEAPAPMGWGCLGHSLGLWKGRCEWSPVLAPPIDGGPQVLC